MPSILNSDSGAVSGSAGLKYTSADDGALEIQTSGNTAVSVANTKIVTFNQTVVQPTPFFRAIRTTNQTLSSGISAPIQFNSVPYDPYSWWDPTNWSFKPQIAGYYWLSCIIHASVTSNTRRIITIFCSGDANIRAADDNINASTNIRTGGGIAYFNGTTDYTFVSATVTGTSPVIVGVADGEYGRFEGYLLRAV
jgi:hypothetical protein